MGDSVSEQDHGCHVSFQLVHGYLSGSRYDASFAQHPAETPAIMARILGAAALLPVVQAEPNNAELFASFKETYGKVYNGDEESRFEIFKANVDEIEAENAQNLGYEMGINQFSDLSKEEFLATYTGLKGGSGKMWSEVPTLGEHVYTGEPLAESVDWTQAMKSAVMQG